MGSITTPHHYHRVAAALSSSYTSLTSPVTIGSFYGFPRLSLPFSPNPFPNIPKISFILRAKKQKSPSQKLLDPSLVKEVLSDDDFDEAYFEDELMTEDRTPQVGDGGGGGGISLAGTKWDKEALAIAEEVSLSFGGDLGIYAFKTSINFSIRVRIEKLSNKSGSPTMEDVEAFTLAYRKRLDEAGVAGSIPENISLEVSSPGVERVVRIPEDLERFKDRPMYVKYVTENAVATVGSPSEYDGVFRLESFDIENKSCTWGTADVRVNREKAGKGRPLTRKQKEWRLNIHFDSLRLVRLYSEI